MANYILYHRRDLKIIEVKKAPKVFEKNDFTNEVVKYNDCYYLSTNRRLLVEKALEIKKEWLDEVKKDLVDIEAIEIK